MDVDAIIASVVERLAPALAAELEARGGESSEPWRLLSLAEAAERLGRSERQVRGWVKSGELTVVRLDGGALAFDVDDLRTFVHARRVGLGVSAPLAERWQEPSRRSVNAASRPTRPAHDRRVST